MLRSVMPSPGSAAGGAMAVRGIVSRAARFAVRPILTLVGGDTLATIMPLGMRLRTLKCASTFG